MKGYGLLVLAIFPLLISCSGPPFSESDGTMTPSIDLSQAKKTEAGKIFYPAEKQLPLSLGNGVAITEHTFRTQKGKAEFQITLENKRKSSVSFRYLVRYFTAENAELQNDPSWKRITLRPGQQKTTKESLDYRTFHKAGFAAPQKVGVEIYFR